MLLSEEATLATCEHVLVACQCEARVNFESARIMFQHLLCINRVYDGLSQASKTSMNLQSKDSLSFGYSSGALCDRLGVAWFHGRAREHVRKISGLIVFRCVLDCMFVPAFETRFQCRPCGLDTHWRRTLCGSCNAVAIFSDCLNHGPL